MPESHRSSPGARLPARIFIGLLALQYRIVEPELRHLRSLVDPSRSAVDVGASLGSWSWWLARHAPVVHAFEPNADLAAALTRSLPTNVRVHAQAVSNRIGEATLSIPSKGPSAQQRVGARLLGVGGRLGLEGRASLLALGGPSATVPTVTLDSLDLGPVGFLKIDVEGHELEVLEGALGVLERDRPKVLLEIEHQFHSGGRSIHDTFHLLTSRGYEGRFLLKGRWHPIAQFDVQRHQLATVERVQRSGQLWNMLFNSRRYVNNFVFTPEDAN